MKRITVMTAALFAALISCDTPLEDVVVPLDPPNMTAADFTIPNAQVSAAGADELAQFVKDGYTYIAYDGDIDAVFTMPDSDYALIFNNTSITMETPVNVVQTSIYTKGDLFIPENKSLSCANLYITGNLVVEGSLTCASLVSCKGSIEYSGSGIESPYIISGGVFNANVNTLTTASLITGGDLNVRNNITAGAVYVFGNVFIDGGKALSSEIAEITVEKDLTIHSNGVEGGCLVSATDELVINGDIYIDGNSNEKIRNASLPSIVVVGNKRLNQLNEIYDVLNRAAGFKKLNLSVGENKTNDVLTEKIIIPEGADIVISGGEYARGLTIGADGEILITGAYTKVVFDTNVSISGKLNISRGAAAETGKDRELDIIGSGSLSIIDNTLKPENTLVISRAVMKASAPSLLIFDSAGCAVNLFYAGENKYGGVELKNGGGISITGAGGINIYGGAADEGLSPAVRLYGRDAVFSAASTNKNVSLQASAEGGVIKIPAAAQGSPEGGVGAVFTANGAAVINFGAEHTAKDGIALGGVQIEGASPLKGTLRLLNGAYIGSASIPIITAGGGSITQIGTLAPEADTDFSSAGTFVQSGYNSASGLDIQNFLSTTEYGTISVGIDTQK
jgi:hypothetical protein